MKSIKTNYIYSLLYQILSIILPLITTPYLSRILGSENLGTYSLNFSIVQYFSLFVLLGLNNYGNRVVAACRDDKGLLSTNFINIYVFQVFCGVIVSGVYLGYILLISTDIEIASVFFLYLFTCILDISWFFFGMEKFKMTVLKNLVIKVISTISVFIFVKTSEDTTIYCLIVSLTNLVSQIILWLYLKREIVFVKPDMQEIIKHIKPNCTLFITVIFVSIFKLMDKVMLGILSARSELGFYEASEKIIAVPTSIVVALGTVMLPRTTNLLATGNRSTAERYLYISCIFSVFISSSICFGIMGVSKEFVPLYYGYGFERCVTLYLILLPTCLFLAFGNVIRTQYLLPNAIDKPYIISAAIGAGVNLVINLLCIPFWGSVGAAIGTLFAEFSVCLYQLLSVARDIPIKKYITHSIPFVFSGVLMFLGLYFVRIPLSSVYLQIAAKIVLGFFIYFITLGIQYLVFRYALKKEWFDVAILHSLLKKHNPK